MSNTLNEEKIASFIRMLADEAGNAIRPFFANKQTRVETKSDNTPVTEADQAAERIMRSLINKHFPDHGIIGEEFGNENEDAEFVWVIDPIDGTKSFTTAVPLFGSLFGLLYNKQPIWGCINQPILGDFCIGNGKQTWLNGKTVRVSEKTSLKDAVLLTTSVETIGKQKDAQAYARLASSVRFHRTWGDCYGYLLVASGWADIMTDSVLSPWDLLPLIPIIRGAGGIITDWDGNDPLKGNSAIAANPELHRLVMEKLHG